MNPTQGGWLILTSLAVAMVLAVAHLPASAPEWVAWLRPSWLVVVIFYWVMALPHRLGLITAWCVGVLVDVLLVYPLGVNGACFAAITYVTWRFYERLRMYSTAQQAAVVFLMALAVELVRLGAASLARADTFTWWVLGPALMSTLIWPLAAYLLRGVRRQFQVV